MLVNGNDILLKAREGHYGVGAFNVFDFGCVDAVLGAAEATNTPVIAQILDWHPDGNFGSRPQEEVKMFMDMLIYRAKLSPVPVCIHLDHCQTYEGCIRAIKYGATSVMLDASMKPFEENIALTKKVIEAAHACGVTVEAEIGHVDGHEGDTTGKLYTTPEQAKEFYAATGVDSLAVAVGTVHGVYREAPQLQYDLISELREAIPAPLVMHGGSGLSPEQYKECVNRGITKINFATYMLLAGGKGIGDVIAKNAEEGKSNNFLDLYPAGVGAMKDIVMEHIGYFQTKPIA